MYVEWIFLEIIYQKAIEIVRHIKAIHIEKECAEDDLIKIEGKFKNLKLAWTKVYPEEEVKIMWEAIKNYSERKGIEEIGEASATFEHCFEFWGIWRVMKPGLTLKYLEHSENWTNQPIICTINLCTYNKYMISSCGQ